MTDATPHIEVRDLVVRYGDVTAVGPVSFSIEPGRQLTLLGPSGCGKTTSLRAVAGLEKPSEGRITVGGRTFYDGQARINVPAEERGLSMVFQSYAIWPHMTVFENVAYGLRVRRKSTAEITRKVGEALDLVQMGPYAQRHASQLSGGQQQRVALARACAFSPSVLLFDEPLSNLDAKLRATCGSSCASCSTGSASPRSTSRTTWRRRSPCPTASSSCGAAGSSNPARRRTSTTTPARSSWPISSARRT